MSWIDRVLDDAVRNVRAWPEWMQRPEVRMLGKWGWARVASVPEPTEPQWPETVASSKGDEMTIENSVDGSDYAVLVNPLAESISELKLQVEELNGRMSELEDRLKRLERQLLDVTLGHSLVSLDRTGAGFQIGRCCMSPEKVLEVIERYRGTFEHQPVNMEGRLEPRLEHCQGMLDKMVVFVREGRMEKTFRWLGFLQGVLWALGVYDLEDLKSHNRPTEDEGK